MVGPTFHATASVRFVFEIVGPAGALENITFNLSLLTFHFKMASTANALENVPFASLCYFIETCST